MSAELNALDRIGVERSDMIVLLSTDNAPGRACSESLKDVLIKYYDLGGCQVRLERIEGLQVNDAERLREKGLKNFINVVLKYLEDDQYRYSYETILSPTGGYKGVLPFLTTLGMLYGKRSVYIFEFADELIHLPPLPFSFDLALFQRVSPALSYMYEEVAVSEEAFLGKILDFTPSERELFMTFTEPFDGGKITISPLAYCLLNIEEKQESCLVCKKVVDKLEKTVGTPGIVLQRLIVKSGSPMWRNFHLHRWGNTDLLIMKPGNTPERIAGFVKKGKFHVTHAFSDHQEYERTLGKYSKKDFAETEFMSWEPEKDPGIELNDRDALAEERDDLMAETQKLQEKLKVNATQRKNLKRKVEQLTDKLEKHRLEIEKLRKQVTNFDDILSENRRKPAADIEARVI
jgi:putative CRISPR-associated protein (TIGR02619 family)